MNNYFGIGLDAKISLEFNNKRDEHPKKCRYGTGRGVWKVALCMCLSGSRRDEVDHCSLSLENVHLYEMNEKDLNY